MRNSRLDIGKSVALVFLGLCFALVFGACDRSDFEPSAHQTSADLELLEDGSASALRAMETTSPDWKEGSYDAVLDVRYLVERPKRVSKNQYLFRVTASSIDPLVELWIKYQAPKGDIVYEKFERKNGAFEILRTFRQDGYYKILVYASHPSGVYPCIMSGWIGFTVEIPVNVPPFGNDYSRYMKPSGYDREKNIAYDQWYFGQYQCTSWVALKVNQMWGTEKLFQNKMFGNSVRLGDALSWKNVLTKHGYIASQRAMPGDIIWFPPNVRVNNVTYSRGLGHVGFVHEVNNEITYSNYDGGVVTSYRVSTTNEAFVRRNGIYFIHIQRKK